MGAGGCDAPGHPTGNRPGSYEHTSSTFLGYEFRPRKSKGKNGVIFTSFAPAVSPKALKAAGQVVRRWRLHLWTGRDLAEIARQINPVMRGWINYYGRFGREEL